MFLKRLEIHGFKSFAHRTTIDFLDGVTIVVGPNGCGKSNVLDAIRWVLGETSAKSLRGDKMGDVLFRGSSSLKAANYAQVMLTVDNQASLLKMDQSEVSVARRLFSDGDSEYLVNKQKARMRDIHELFLDTGLGADGYSIIEQGQIGQIVGAKPRERREIFEEAAGISRYKARREETLRKLIRTEEDLIRLFDIVSEVERACNSLYRQAKKAERHRRLTTRLQRLQKRLIVLRHEQLRTKLTEVEAKLEGARSLFEEANTKLATAEASRAEASRLAEEYQRKLQELQQEKYDLQAAVNREQRRIESAKQTLQAIADRASLLEREMSSSTNRLSVLENTIAALEVDLERDRQKLGTEQVELDEKSRRLDALRREHDVANMDLAKLRQDLQADRAREAKVQQDMRLSESLIERLSNELQHHEATTSTLRSEAEEAGKEAAAAREMLEARRAKIAAVKEEWRTLADELSQSDKQKDALTQELDKVTRQWNTSSSRLQALQEVEDSYEGFFRGVQVVMKASQNGQLKGVYGVLSNVLTVPKDYETAIEVTLGGSLQDIITLTEENASAAIELLKRTNSGRATFLPLNHLERLQTPVRFDMLRPLIGRQGVVGIAKELISYDPLIEQAVLRRLGNTLVVDVLPTALRLQREGLRNRIVSLDGQLADPSGIMTGGSHQTRGLLSRSREIRQLRDEVTAIDAQRKDLAAKLASTKDRLSQIHARAAELQATLHQEQMGEARSERDVQSSEARAKDRRNSLATAEARQVQQRHDLGQHEDKVLVCMEALEKVSAAVAEKEAQLKSTETLFSGRSTELTSLSEAVAGGRAHLSALRDRVNSLTTKLEEVRRDIGNAGSEQGRREAERAVLEQQRETSVADQAAAELLLADLVRQRDELEARISAMMQENEATLREARQGLAEIQAFQRDRNVRENALREVETQATELRAQMSFLKQEAHDEFQLTIEEIAASLAEQVAEGETLIAAPSGVADNDDSADDPNGSADEALVDANELRRTVNELRASLQRLGAVNETAIEEYKTQKERLDFLTAQRDDLIKAKDALQETITKLDETTTRLFHEAFDRIRANFQENFRRLFTGGKGDLVLVADEKEVEPGIDIFAQPPGKNIGGSINLMSGGEKAMTAICLMLSLFQFKPSPICILDEIDAPLDDVNCQRLCNALRDYAKTTQFLIVTHNKITMALADTIYGVTMQEPGISKLVSVRFDRIDESGLLEPV